MPGFATRAEQIAAHLVAHETGALAVPHDTNGRQAAVDFLLEWSDGRCGALEVTLIAEPQSIAWQGMAARDGWRWPSKTSWELRPTGLSFNYKHTRRLVMRAIELCDLWSVDTPADLPKSVLETAPGIAELLADGIGTLRRTSLSPGVILYPTTRAEFVDSTPSDFCLVVERWHHAPHMAPHIAKVKNVPRVAETHLFLVPLDDVLPAQFFTDDFEAPERPPRGFDGVNVLWIWSNYWHLCLIFRDQTWRWLAFPPLESDE